MFKSSASLVPCREPTPVANAELGRCTPRTRGRKGSAQARAALLREPVSALGLSTRANTILRRARIQTVGDLVQLMPRDLLKEQHCGPGTVSEIESKLSPLGLLLGMTGPEHLSG